MHVDVPKPFPHQLMDLDKPHDLFVLGRHRAIEGFKQLQNFFPVFKIAACQLTDDQYMTSRAAFLQKGCQITVSLA